MKYRKRKDSDTWHFCRNCLQWPTKDYEEKKQKPTTAKLCIECQAKEQNDNCQK
jgi:hypothetical protein